MARICPKVECRERFTHGHGGDETYLPRLVARMSTPVIDLTRPGFGRGTPDPIGEPKMEVCPSTACRISDEHMHLDASTASGYTPYFLPRPIPACPVEDCFIDRNHYHGPVGEFRPRDNDCPVRGCMWPGEHQHGATGERDGTMHQPSDAGWQVLAFHATAGPQREKSIFTKVPGNAPDRWRWSDGSIWTWDTLVEPEPRFPSERFLPNRPEGAQGQFAFTGKTDCGHSVSHQSHDDCSGLVGDIDDQMVRLDEVAALPGFNPGLSPHLVPSQTASYVPEPETNVPSIGGFDAALYAAFTGGAIFGRMEEGGNTLDAFLRWRAQWQGEWVTAR